MNTEQLAPHSVEAEQAVLGAILISPDALQQAMPFVKPEHFFIVRNGWIFEAMLDLHERRDPVDYLMIVEELTRRGRLAESGGAAYLVKLINETPNALNVDGYAGVVRRMAWRREALDYAGKVARLAHADNPSIQDLHRQMSEGLNKLGGGVLRGRRTSADLASEFFDQAAEADRTGQKKQGWSTGFTLLDKLFGSTYGPGGFNVFGGYTNQGKTQIAAELAAAAAIQGPVLYVTLESLPEAIFNRLVAARSGVSLTRVIERDLGRGDDFAKATAAAMELGRLPLEIETLESVSEIEAYVTDMSIRYDFHPGMIFIDDMDSLAESARGGSPYERLGGVSTALLRTTLRTGWGVVALKQLLMPTEATGVTSSDKLFDMLKPNIMSFEGGRTIVQKGGNVITMLSAEWIRAKVYSKFVHPNLKDGYVYFWKHKSRDARSDSVVEVPLKFNADVPRYEDVMRGNNAY